MAKKSNGGTALVPFNVNQYPALVEGSDLREAIEANAQGTPMQESDLVRVPTPAGGAKQWVVPGISGEETVDELVGILVYFAPRGVLWPTEDIGNSPPLLVSNDLVTATRQGDDFGDIDPDELEKYATGGGRYDWQKLPWNQWGSGKNGTGKRCKESRLLMLLREGSAFPLLVRAQPGSLKTVRPFIMQLPVPHWRAVVGLSLQVANSKGAGVKYSQIVPRLVDTLPREIGDQVRKLYTEQLAGMAAGAMASDAEG